MDDETLWREVGQVLARRRTELGYGWTKTLKRAHGKKAPHENTLNTIEAGEPGNVASLHDYCDVLGLRLADVIASVLPSSALPAEAMRVAQEWQAAPEIYQRAVLAVLKTVPPARATKRGGARRAPSKTLR